MNPERILAKAEAWKRKTHRLSIDLRLRSVQEATAFLREHGVVLWNAKAELPNLLDAIIGRVANGQERVYGKPAENCYRWREQIMSHPDFLECRFFSKLSTVLHQDLWPSATVFARINRKKTEEGTNPLSKDARKILGFLQREGPTRTDVLRKALKFSSPEQGRLFHRAKRDLQNHLVILGKEDHAARVHTHAEILDLWENCMPRPVRTKAEQLDPANCRLKLLSMTLQGCVLSNEKRISSWFAWCDGVSESLEKLLQKKDFVRVPYKKDSWIISRKVVESKSR